MSDIHDLAAAYLLDELSEAERAAFVDHLGGCPACQAELSELEEGAATLFWASSEPPPESLRVSVNAAIDGEVVPLIRRVGFRLGAVAAVVVLVVLASISLRADPIADVVDSPDAIAIEVPSTSDNPDDNATVTLTYSPSEEAAVIVATGLDPIPEGQTYEMWIIDQSGPMPAGLFRPAESGEARVLVAALPEAGATFGITIEPSGGSDLPTGDVLYAAEVS